MIASISLLNRYREHKAMQKLMILLQQYGLLILFGNVLLEQLGLPIPAVPVLVVAGALAAIGKLFWLECLAVALLACLVSDFIWYSAGRRYGSRILKLLCRISISPDYCVSQTEDTFNRWGPKSMIVAKFVPGFSTIAPPMAGAMGTSRERFLAYALSGGLLWTCTFMGLGAIFHDSIDDILHFLSTMGVTALAVIAAIFGLIVAVKFYERRRFYKALRMARITVDELTELIDGGHHPVIIDARSRTAQQMEAPIPGALLYNRDAPDDAFINVSRSIPIIVYCSCPNEASAAVVAKQLINHGFREVRPLIGGLDAWNERMAKAASAQQRMEAQPG